MWRHEFQGKWARGWLALVFMLTLAPGVRAQETASADRTVSLPVPPLSASEMGLAIGSGPVTPGGDRRVLVKDGDELVVARLYVEAGNRVIALMPDGRLASYPKAEATDTDRPFVGIPIDKLKKKLAEKFPGFKIRNTKRFVYVYNTSDVFYKGTSTILETMFPNLLAYCKRQKIDAHEPETPLVVVMFKTRKQWQEFNAALFKDKETDVVAYYSPVFNRVVMYEESDVATNAPEAAIKLAISTIAHEGVHQILGNIGVQQRLSRWPMWISEGLPEYFSPTDVSRGVRWKGIGLVNDFRLKNLLDTIKQQSGSGQPGDMVRKTVTADSLTVTGYAFAWGLTHFLAERRKEKFVAYLADVSKTEPLAEDRSAAGNEALFVKHFGGDYAALEKDFIAHIKGLPYVDPYDNMTHYVVLTTYMKGNQNFLGWYMTSSPSDVQKYEQEKVASLAPSDQPTVRFDVKMFPTRTTAQQFAEAWMNQ